MIDKKENVPKVRFPGFTGPWEQRKAKDLFTPIVEKGHEKLPVLSVTQEFGVVYRDEVGIDIKYDPSTLKDYKVIHPGDFVISLRSFQGGFELSDKLGITSPAYTIFKPTETKEHDNLFWKTLFKTFKFIESLKTVTFGIRDGKSISFSEFGDLTLHFPSSIDEQSKIGEFFRNLENLICFQQRKLNDVKSLKAGLLQKMFPADGEDFPEVRFPGFTDAWEQRKLGDFIEDFIEKTTIQNQYPVLTSSQQMGIVFQEEYFANRQVTTDENIGYFVMPKGYFTYRSRSDNGVFVFNRNDLIDKGIISYFYPVFRVKNADSDFFLRRLNFGIERQITIAAEGTGQHVLSLKKFKDIEAMFPSIQEQEEIGSFFNNLDNLITLHQRKLEHLQEQKKALLQQMFV